jgi:hypothetical protein
MPRIASIFLGRALTWFVSIALGAMLAACGSGGGSGTDPGTGGGGGGTGPLGALTVTVTDTYGTAVAGALVSATLGTSTVVGGTDANGVALLAIAWPDGTAEVDVTRDTFLDTTVSAPIVAGAANQVAVTVRRATAPAGGFLASRSNIEPTVTDAGQRVTFEVEVVVVDGNSDAIATLARANFALLPCTPDPANGKVDCLRGSDPSIDAAYTPVNAVPDALALIPGGTPYPYAAGLLLDQSTSIAITDPTGARLFSAKALMENLGADDKVLLAAFASGSEARIPTQPLTVYPPFRTRATASEYFPTLDALAPLVGGVTPLYASIDLLREQIVAGGGTLARSIVVFTDGADTSCGTEAQCSAARLQTIQNAATDQVRLFTIGLSSGVDVEALVDLASRTGGAMLFAETAEQLLPLYGSVGRMLSLSLPTYRLRWTVDAGAPGVFLPGTKLLGRVRVSADGREFQVPIIVGIV